MYKSINFALFLALILTGACKTPGPADSQLQDSSAIQTMTRSGDNFEITCLDGSSQTVSIADFPEKDPREICPGIGFSECAPRVLYSNGRELKSSNGTYYYPNGTIAISPDGKIRYNNGQQLNDNSGILYFADGSILLGQNSILMYPEGNTLRGTNGTLYYPDKSTLATQNGGLKYPGNQMLSDDSGNFYYSDDRSRRLKSGDTFYYRDGSTARSGQSLYRPEDHKLTQTPIIIEEAVNDGSIVRGLLRFTISQTQFSYILDLPKLHPNVIARYESKKNSWFFRYRISNTDFPVQLTFDGKNTNRTLYLRTGYANDTAIIDFTKTPVSCHIVNTAAQSPAVPR